MGGKRYSRQRELVREAVRGSREHPTAEMVYQSLLPSLPELSRGTVYRNLNLLCQEGTLNRLAFPVERFDPRTEPHSHFCCQSCGRVLDLDLPYDSAADRAAAESSGFRVEGHEVMFRGMCDLCLGKERE